MNILFGGAVVALLNSRIPPIYLGLLIIGMIYAQAYIMLYQKVNTGNLQCDLIADGQFIVLALLMGGVISTSTAILSLTL